MCVNHSHLNKYVLHDHKYLHRLLLTLPPLTPLIQRLPGMVKQAWYPDDVSACGELHDLYFRWDQLSQFRPLFGYYPNAKKTWLVVKPQYLELACQVFDGINVINTADIGLTWGLQLELPPTLLTMFLRR